MVNVFGFGKELASSCRVESHFNNLKNRLFKNEELHIRADSFVDKITKHYAGDHLLLQSMANLNELRAEPVEHAQSIILPVIDEVNCSDIILIEENSKKRTTQSRRDIELFYENILSEKSPTEDLNCAQCIACDNGPDYWITSLF
jgi:hypothetical protein